MVAADMVKACYRALPPRLKALLLEVMYIHKTKIPQSIGTIVDTICNDVNRHIDYDVSPDQLTACFARIRREWTMLGDEEPYWSVSTNEAFKLKNFDAKAVDDFFASGRTTVSHLKNFLARNGRELPKGHCLEFGCGTGRVTRHLALLFEHVTGVDISPGNLKLAAENMRDMGVSNVSFKLLETLEQLAAMPAYDFLFSTIVLQHNPPPLQNFILDKLFARLQPGGGAFVQIPTNTPGYNFRIDDYLNSSSPGLEMHDLPMHVVFARLDQHNMVPIEVLADNWTSMFGSHTFFAIKKGARPVIALDLGQKPRITPTLNSVDGD